GRHLLANPSSPITVDGLAQMSDNNYRAAPEAYRNDIFRPVYGRAGSANAYRTSLRRRWHTSEFFDVLEGQYSGPFARTAPNVFIGDVSHQRQIIFARKLGLWIVIDRLKSPTEHNYEWVWPFYCPGGDDAKRYPGFTGNQIKVDAKTQSIKTDNPSGPNLSLYSFCAEPLEKTGSAFKTIKKSGDFIVVTALYPRKFEDGEVAPDLANVTPNQDAKGECSFSATIPGGVKVEFQAAPFFKGPPKPATQDSIWFDAEAFLVVAMADGCKRGVALGCKDMAHCGAKQAIPGPDFEFLLTRGKLEKCEPIYVPLELPQVAPAEDRFSDELKVMLSHSEPQTELRYTLDGSDPGGDSPLYREPFAIQKTTVVKARAFRKGVTQVPQTSDSTKVSAVMRAVFTKEPPWEPAKPGETKPGLAFTCYEDDGTWPISAFNLDALKAAGSGTCSELFDVSATKNKNGGFAFVYTGFLDVPKDGVYSLHAPPEFITPSVHAGYDLRVYLGGKEWYPATQAHNFGAWSLPLKAGKHALKAVYINQQNVHLMSDFENWKEYYWQGTKPNLTISGPGLSKQPIPAGMLCR
ncbi:MAG: FN3 associated domain-containing protein, partial [Planctomycetota bacterium]